ncbi:MAG: RtcB family protein [Anaerolineales bacterium]|jgi:tRNA-splicing ligase RtcB
MIETHEGRVAVKRWVKGLDAVTETQIRNISNLDVARAIAIMPDAHVGYGMPIGGVLATKDAVIPNAVGVDIGCGMCAVRTDLTELDTDALKQIMGIIRLRVPLGFNHHNEPQKWVGFGDAPDVQIIQEQLQAARMQLGTLGGGNHFIEIQHGSDGAIWCMIHSGSRNFGLRVADDYHHKAVAYCDTNRTDLPSADLAYLQIRTRLGQEYLSAMEYACTFAEASRAAMMTEVLHAVHEVAGGNALLTIETRHNYARLEVHNGEEVYVHRKGAVFAGPRQQVIIPGSMGSPSYIASGLGNPEAMNSSSHGAGRRMGRGAAKRQLNLADEQAKMVGIVHGLRTRGDLDEAPGAYKSIDEVMANQADLVTPIIKLTPLASIKG